MTQVTLTKMSYRTEDILSQDEKRQWKNYPNLPRCIITYK